MAISFYTLSRFHIMPCHLSEFTLAGPQCLLTPTDSHNLCRPCLQAEKINSLNNKQCFPKGNKNLTFSLFSRM